MEKQTPMMEQYLRIKDENKDAILLFHLGDFYEMFFEDAKTASKILHITLTSRGAGENKMPMAGIPCHAAENYIARLIKAGYKVAICEQVQDPGEARGLVKREVTRVITPGTLTESTLLEEKSNNYILSFTKSKQKFGIAFADISTGEFRLTEAAGIEEFQGELCRLDPGEFVFPDELADDPDVKALTADRNRLFTALEGWKFSPQTACRELQAHFKVKTLDGFGAEDYPAGIAAAGALISYLKNTQKTALNQITRVRAYSLSGFMVLDRATQRNLELSSNLNDASRSGTLLEVIDETVTPAGSRLIKSWLLQPLLNVEEIRKRQDAAEELFTDGEKRREIRKILSDISDMERLMGRISSKRANARDLTALKNSLQLVIPLKKILEGCSPELLKEIFENLTCPEGVIDLIEKTITEDPPPGIKEGGIIRQGCDPELDELRRIKKDGKKWIAELQAREAARTGINSLRVGYNRIFGYYIELTKANLKDAPPDYTRKQTLVNAERFITPELKEHESRVFNAAERMQELEYEIYCRVREKIAETTAEIQNIAYNISMLDVISNFSNIAVNGNWIKPAVAQDDKIKINGGRHPVMERVIGANDFVANDLSLDSEDNRIKIITGPNMAGKSTYIRQSAILVIMAQAGSFIPAESAHIGIVDRIFTRVGASDDIARGRSTFMVEMNETANILASATPKSFIILDEIGRGTSTYDGVSIAWAVVEYLHNHPELSAKTLFATHYLELTSLSEILPAVKNLRVLVREHNGGIIFLRKVAEGISDKSYGIHVARLAGLPAEVISRAYRVLRHLEAGAIEASVESFARESSPAAAALIPLFTEKEQSDTNKIIEEIKSLNVEAMTPLDALTALSRFKEKIADGS